jgi:hypothetical protein
VKQYTDSDLLRLYSQWSEEAYAAGFIDPTESSVRSFLNWLMRIPEEIEPVEDYEFEMLKIAREQLKEYEVEEANTCQCDGDYVGCQCFHCNDHRSQPT